MRNAANTQRLRRASVQLYPEQLAAVRAEANAMATKNGGRADASAVIRDVLDAWLRKQGRGAP